MTTDLARRPTALVEAASAAALYTKAARAPATRRAYAADFRTFDAWCRSCRLNPIPASPRTIGLYAARLAQAGRRPSTIERALVSIGLAHRLLGLDAPTSNATVREVVKGIRRTHKGPARAARAILPAELRQLVAGLPGTLRGTRDRALILLGFASALRRSELVALNADDLAFDARGVVVTLRRSKTDQEGRGRKIGVPRGSSLCPVAALESWLTATDIVHGAVFRSVSAAGLVGDRLSDRSVALVLQRACARAGVDLARVSGHSLRSGFVTAALDAKATKRQIRKVTGHKSDAMLDRYDRGDELFEDSPLKGVL